jgi:hypothetical protein
MYWAAQRYNGHCWHTPNHDVYEQLDIVGGVVRTLGSCDEALDSLHAGLYVQY